MATDIEVLDQRVGLGWEGKHRGFAEPRFLSEEARPHHHPRVFRKIPSPLLSPNRPVLESGGWRDTTYPLFFVFFCPRANLVYIHTIIFPSNVHPSSPTVLFLILVTGCPVFRAPERDAFEGKGGVGEAAFLNFSV